MKDCIPAGGLLKPSTRRALHSSSTSFKAADRVHSAIRTFLTLTSLFLLLALITYHPQDPAWSHIGLQNKALNSEGIVGSWIADILFFTLGYVAYTIPIMWWIYLIDQHTDWLGTCEAQDTPELSWLSKSCRGLGFILIGMTSCASLSLYFPSAWSHQLPASAGGVLGQCIGLAVFHGFSTWGSILVLLGLLLCGMSLITSWRSLLAPLMPIFTRIIHIRLRIPSLWPQKIQQQPLAPVPPPVEHKAIEEEQLSPSKQQLLIQQPSNQTPTHQREQLPAPQPIIVRQQDGHSLPPPLSLLDQPKLGQKPAYNRQQLQYLSREVEQKLKDFAIVAQVVAVHPGPVITRFEVQLKAGTKVSKISSLSKDLARSLSVMSVRVVEVIPGKSVIGLELPNVHREKIFLREVLLSKSYNNSTAGLSLALGKDISGHAVVVDLAKMPHLLVAGATGSGKSVSVNGMLLSLLYKFSPEQMRLILIDPKMLEFSIYDGIAHLLTPVVTDMKDAVKALRWGVVEMERRYRLMATLGVRNVAGYNKKIKAGYAKGLPLLDPFFTGEEEGEQQKPLTELPLIVVIVDELADLIMVSGKKVEDLIARIAQKARASGIHLILATQRPSVDVITGLIKANIPARIAFQVPSKIDSRIILDRSGAEQLLPHCGDMLYRAPGASIPIRIHGAYVSDEEVHRVVNQLRSQCPPDYAPQCLEEAFAAASHDSLEDDNSTEKDSLYDHAVALVTESRRVSISMVQRRFKIGYNRAARIVEAMETAGLVSSPDHKGQRDILIPHRQHEEA